MKKIIYSLALASLATGFVACNKNDNSSPTNNNPNNPNNTTKTYRVKTMTNYNDGIAYEYSLEYDAEGRATKIVSGSSVNSTLTKTLTWKNDSLIILTEGNGTPKTRRLALTRNGDGYITKITEKEYTWEYSYDAAGHLTRDFVSGQGGSRYFWGTEGNMDSMAYLQPDATMANSFYLYTTDGESRDLGFKQCPLLPLHFGLFYKTSTIDLPMGSTKLIKNSGFSRDESGMISKRAYTFDSDKRVTEIKVMNTKTMSYTYY